MTVYIANSLSLNMFDCDKVEMSFKRCTDDEARAVCAGQKVVSAVRHGLEKVVKDSTAIAATEFEQMKQLKLGRGTYRMLVLQYTGPRLEPGTVVLPRGAKLVWFEGTVKCV